MNYSNAILHTCQPEMQNCLAVWHNWAMGRAKKPTPALENAVLRVLNAKRESAGLDETALAIKAGLIQSTVNRQLRGESALSFSILVPLCDALGVRVSTVIRQAEDSIRDHSVASDPITYAEQAEAKLNQLLQSNYTPAAKHHEPDPYDSVGEENQDEEEN
ncbi:helix-turn-helix domain-containing protein [Trueperella pyogenes]